MKTFKKYIWIFILLGTIITAMLGCAKVNNPITYNISGSIIGASGVTVTLSGDKSATTTTDSDGKYSFSGLNNGSYRITPSISGYSFSPSYIDTTINNADSNGINFSANQADKYSIAGTITGATAVTINLSGAATSATTCDASGFYSFNNLDNGTYTVTPSKSGYTFSPTSETLVISGASVTNANFVANTASKYSISGTISGATSVTINLSGNATATTTCDSSGFYSFSNLDNGNYMVIPSKLGYYFTPTSEAVDISGSSVLDINFSATISQSIVDDSDGYGFVLSMAIDNSNHLHLAYSNFLSTMLKYATNSSGAWVSNIVDQINSTNSPSIAVDSSGIVHVAYNTSAGNLMYAVNNTGTWATTQLESGAIDGNAYIAVDSTGKSHIIFTHVYSSSGQVKYELRYATNPEGWSISTVEATGSPASLSIAIDGSNKIHVCYFDEVTYALKYLTNSSGAWTSYTVDAAGDLSPSASIAVGSDGVVRICYSTSNKIIKYAYGNTNSWTISSIDSNTHGYGPEFSICLDSRSKAYISYHDIDDSKIKYITNRNTAWVKTTIDAASDGRADHAIAFDNTNNILYVSYYDGSTHLKCASFKY